MPTEMIAGALGASYVLEERLGRGATGEVWRGTERRTGRPVAAKVLHRAHLDDHVLVERFVRERSILVGLRHPNVVAVRDFVVEPDRLAIVMELVDGGSLRDVLDERGPLRPAVALRVVAAVLDGLAAAHDRRVRHGDVKPDNVLLARGWSHRRPGSVRLSDFGVAEILGAAGPSSSGPVGTPGYLAPEQVLTGAAGLPADVYGAGVLLHELLTGATPSAGLTTGDHARRSPTREPPPLPVSDPVRAALAALLAEDPARRPTAREAAEELRRLAPSVSELDPLRRGTPGDALPELGPSRRDTVLRAMPLLPAPSPVAPERVRPVGRGRIRTVLPRLRRPGSG